MNPENNPFGEVIFSYTRKQAIEDGVLVDLSHIETVREHWKHLFACTEAVWAIIERALKGEGQDVNGIMHDISVTAEVALKAPKDVSLVIFRTIIAGFTYTFKLHIGPGDEGEAVLTLMLPNED